MYLFIKESIDPGDQISCLWGSYKICDDNCL